MLYSSYITLASLILTSSVVSAIGTLRPYIQLILPTNTVQNQTSPPAVFGALIEPIDAIQAYSFTLTLPNGTLALSAHFTLSCGTSSDPGNSSTFNLSRSLLTCSILILSSISSCFQQDYLQF